MAENPYLDLAIEVAVERYGLNEEMWGMTSFTEGSKTISVGLTDGVTKLRISFDRDDIRFEEIKRWSNERKKAYVEHLMGEGKELPPELVDSFQEVMIKLDLPESNSLEDDFVENTVIVEVGEEETEEGFKDKVKTGKFKKFNRKAVGN